MAFDDDNNDNHLLSKLSMFGKRAKTSTGPHVKKSHLRLVEASQNTVDSAPTHNMWARPQKPVLTVARSDREADEQAFLRAFGYNK